MNPLEHTMFAGGDSTHPANPGKNVRLVLGGPTGDVGTHPSSPIVGVVDEKFKLSQV